MTREDSSSQRYRFVRLLGRIIALIAGGIWLFVVVAEFVISLQKGQDVITLEGALLSVLVLTNSVGAVLAWWKPMLGSNILLVGGLALSIFAVVSAGHNHISAVLVSGVPFLLAGIFIWFSSRPLPPNESTA